MAAMKPKTLRCELQQLHTWSSPNCWELEQYATPPPIASEMLSHIQEYYNDVSDKTVADLGCGCGILTVGCGLMGARSVVAVDIDSKSLDILRKNIRMYDGLQDIVSVIEGDVSDNTLSWLPTLSSHVDVVIMNPPFGTKKTPGLDKAFVQTALNIAPVVYSLHKRSTTPHWTKPRVITELNCSVIECVSEIRFNIQKQFKKHKKDSVDIEVDLLRFVKK